MVAVNPAAAVAPSLTTSTSVYTSNGIVYRNEAVIAVNPTAALAPSLTTSTSVYTSNGVVYTSESVFAVAPTHGAGNVGVAPAQGLPPDYVAPSNGLAPTNAAGQCTPCTSYVLETTRASLACTTMIFCDLAEQSEACIAFDEAQIEKIAAAALRDGGQVFVNGQLVVFKRPSDAQTLSNSRASSKTSITRVAAQNSNDAPPPYGMSLFGCIALMVPAILFM